MTEPIITQLRAQLGGLKLPDEAAYGPGMHHKAWRPFWHGISDIVGQLESRELAGDVRGRMNAAQTAVEEDPELTGDDAQMRLHIWSARRNELDMFLAEVENTT